MVRRFTGASGMIPTLGAGFVHTSDYEAIERQLAEARAEYLTASKDAMELAGELNTAEAERDRLAADNARLRDGFAEPDVMAMSNGVISLHYEDLDAAQSAFDWLEARAMGEKK